MSFINDLPVSLDSSQASSSKSFPSQIPSGSFGLVIVLFFLRLPSAHLGKQSDTSHGLHSQFSER